MDSDVGKSGRPFLSLYIVWHPSFAEGAEIAKHLHDHFRSNPITNVAGGIGLSVLNRCFSPPVAIDLAESATTAIVVLVESHLRDDPHWVAFVQSLATASKSSGLTARVFPVALDRGAHSIGGAIADLNFIQWHAWFADSAKERCDQLITLLSYQFCRMLRLYLSHLDNPSAGAQDLESYLQQVRVFVSHSKHDSYGENISKAIVSRIAGEHDLDTFFDVRSIPPGMPFADVILHGISVSAFIAVHTDSFSSREWCRREILAAKRLGVPLVVANCIMDWEERGFPYMGNVPVIRMEPDALHRISAVIGRLLDEVLRAFLWKCRIRVAQASGSAGLAFLPRAPELINLVSLLDDVTALGTLTVVYPEPPIGIEEMQLFESLSPGLVLRSYNEWLATI